MACAVIDHTMPCCNIEYNTLLFVALILCVSKGWIIPSLIYSVIKYSEAW